MELETKTDFVRNHVKMWNKIIDLIKNESRIDGKTLSALKRTAFESLWPGDKCVSNNCFACEWSNREINRKRKGKKYTAPECKKCLFKVTYKKGCMNGLYNELVETKNPVAVAKQIRDFPVK